MPERSPDALLFTAPGCPHCPGLKATLEGFRNEGVLASLQVIDISQQPQQANELGVRSVPWLQLGDFILTGAQTPQQLRQWLKRASDPRGMSLYLAELLKDGELAQAEGLLQRQPRHLDALLPLIADTQSPIQVRLGASALMEAHENSEALRALLPQLLPLTQHADHRVRSDACYYLGLSHHQAAREALQTCLQDNEAEVAEIAREALEQLSA